MTNANVSIKSISTGVVHDVPEDLYKALISDESALERWEDLTPLARNEWICWVISNKRPETRANHVERTVSELLQGVRRPCCWIGCIHRQDKAPNKFQSQIKAKAKTQARTI